MTQSTPERKPCGTCGEPYTVTASGGMRHHFTENPDFQAGPDSRKCRGVGEPPAGAAAGTKADGPQCRLCKHPVELTDNDRARSHLTPEQTPRPCPGGSDFPLGTYPDMVGTTDGLVATLRADCEHVPVGQCYDCYGAGHPQDVKGDLPAEELTKPPSGTAPWGYAAETATQPTMADQLKATPLTEALAQEVGNVGTVLNAMDDDTRAQAERFMDAAPATRSGGGLSTAERERLAAVVATDYRTDEQKAADARTSELTRGAIKVLQQRSPEEKAETAARMDRTASAALGLPLDPALNHKHLDASGVEWVHEGPRDTCPTPECETWRRIHPDGVYCEKCDTDNHRCPGCGTDVKHGVIACAACTRKTCTHPNGFQDTADDLDEDGQDRVVSTCAICGAMDPEDELSDDEDAERLGTCTRCGKPRDGHAHDVGADPESPNCPHPETHRAGCGCPDDDSARREPIDGWRTPLDLMEKMPEDVRGLDALRLNCRECGHPVTPLVDYFAPDGRVVRVVWDCEHHLYGSTNPCRGHECTPDTRARLGELDEDDYFIRRSTLMRVTGETNGVIHAVVVDGPHKGRTGELKNGGETVERAPAPRTTEQETKECPDDKATLQRSLMARAREAMKARDLGSPPPTKASASAVLSQSSPVTSSAPTARAATSVRSAAVTTDQSAAAAAFLGSARPTAPAASGPPKNQADAAAQFLAGGSGAHGEKETKRDRFGRYLIPHPDTGKEQAWTRATTFAKSISDTYALSQWGLRMALLGATMRPDIVQRAHGKHVSADKALLDELTAELKNAAGDKVAANLGTSMHSFTEMADRAWHSPGGPRSILDQVPPDCRADVETYIRLLEETGLEPVPHLIEFTTVVKQYGVAGTSDNCYKVTKPLVLKIGRAEVRLEPGEYVIGDKKTGKDLDYGWQEIAIQLGTYAQGINTSGVWDRANEMWEPDPLSRFDKPGTKVRLDAGIVVHLPVDKGGKKQPAVYGIDLESGWNAAVLCERVRAWRKVRSLASPVMVSEAETFAPARPSAVVKAAPVAGDYDPDTGVVTRTNVRPPSLMDKANAVTSKGEASSVWQEAKKAGLPDTEVDRLVSVMQARLKKLAEPGG